MHHIKHKMQNNKYTFKLDAIGEITVSGFSQAGYKTGYIIEPFNIYLDAGVECDIPANMILVSHGHLDHINALYSLLVNTTKCNVMLDSSLLQHTQLLLNSMSSLNSGKTMTYNNWTPITNKQYSYTHSKNQVFNITTYELSHRVKCRAYSIMINKNKLKPEYIGIKGSELKLLGDEIYNIIEYPLVLFISDTDVSGLENLPFNKHKLVIMECTFFDSNHYEEAVERQHLHWNDVKKIVSKYKETTFILGHFSARYKEAGMEVVKKMIEVDHSNVILLGYI